MGLISRVSSRTYRNYSTMTDNDEEKKLMKEDLYKLLGVPEDADEKTIKKAFRKSALKFHTDKNPDDKKAADKFHKLSQVLKILSDKDKRVQYDIKRKAKARQQENLDKLDKVRKGYAEDLGRREHLGKMAKEERQGEINKERQMRDEGAKILAEELKLMKEQIEKEKREEEIERMNARRTASEVHRLKFKYNPNSLDRAGIEQIFSAALTDSEIVFSKKKKSSGIVETKDFEKARELVNDPIDPDNIKITWYEVPIPPTRGPKFAKMNQTQINFFNLEADVLTALRKAAHEDKESDDGGVIEI